MSNANSVIDKSSFSNAHLNSVNVKHIHLDWKIDFDSCIISGSCTHKIHLLDDNVSEVFFDSNSLSIISLTIGDRVIDYVVEPANPVLGSKIVVSLPEDIRNKGSEFDLTFCYSTSRNAMAVQWLAPSATAGKVYPYVFTQGQAIHSRSMIPCMDTPGVKCTYSARVVAPEWCTVLMSALPLPADESDPKGVFRYTQPVPVCSYLIALAAGEMESREISSRVRVWAEPAVVEAAAFDFSQTEDFVTAAEELVGPYQWTRYDVLCLPPSFPYGGMENPCLTFATPTLLTGDKSLADVIAHEIAHSWTGNLVTNATWEHFWLNEGWTVWLERKIISRIYPGGKDNLLLSAQIGWESLQKSVQQLGETNKFTRLVWPLSGEDPDDAFSTVPYEKGFNLLYQLETLLGTPFFEAFAKAYVEQFKFGHITSEGFRDFLISYCAAAADAEKSALLATLDWDTIFYGEGMPLATPDFSNSMSTVVDELSKKWLAAAASGSVVEGASGNDVAGWNCKQLCVFLETLNNAEFALPPSLLEAMDQAYGLTSSTNAEVKFRWCMLCIGSEVGWIVPHAVALATSQGRMKFVRPLYRALRASDIGAQVAIDTFATYADMYHPIAKKMIQADFAAAQAQETATPLDETAAASEPLV